MAAFALTPAHQAQLRLALSITAPLLPCRAGSWYQPVTIDRMSFHAPADDDLEQVDGGERQQPGSGDEVQRARRLTAAEQIDPAGVDRVQPRRHRQPGHDQQRQQAEDHEQVGQVLQHVVAAGGVTARMPEQQVVLDRIAADAAQFGQRGQQVACQMAAEQRVEQVRDAVDDEDPGKEEVPTACRRQPLATRARWPSSESPVHTVGHRPATGRARPSCPTRCRRRGSRRQGRQRRPWRRSSATATRN